MFLYSLNGIKSNKTPPNELIKTEWSEKTALFLFLLFDKIIIFKDNKLENINQGGI